MRSEVTWMHRKIPAALNDRPGEGGTSLASASIIVNISVISSHES